MLSTIRKLIARSLRMTTDNEVRRRLNAQDYHGAIDMLDRLPIGMRYDAVAQQFRIDAYIELGQFEDALHELTKAKRMELSEAWHAKFEHQTWRTLFAMEDFEALSKILNESKEAHGPDATFLSYQLLAAFHLEDRATASDACEEMIQRVEDVAEPWQLVSLWSALRWLQHDQMDEIAELAHKRFPSDPGVADIPS